MGKVAEGGREMKKEEFIKRYGEGAYEKQKEQMRVWREDHPEEVNMQKHDIGRKGGKHYDKHRIYNQTGLQGDRNVIRATHTRQYKPYKDIIAPDSQIHHEWVPDTSEYRGIALVEKEAHMHGFVDVIEILEGKITLLTEEEVKNGKKNMKDEINKT